MSLPGRSAAGLDAPASPLPPWQAFLRLDKRTWVRPEAVQMVRMGLDNETLIFVGSCETGVSVDASISEVLSLFGSNADPT